MTEIYGPDGPNFVGGNWREAVGSSESVNFGLIKFAELVDVEGVPLNSNRSSLAVATDGSIDWEFGECPYATSPSRLPANQPDPVRPMSFLEQRRLRGSYQDVLGIAGYIRGNMSDRDTEEPFAFKDTYDLLTALKFTLHYLVFRAEDPVDPDNIPTSLLFTHNSSLGALGGLRDGYAGLARQGGVIPAEEPVPPVEEILEKSERMGSLVGPGTVCAASPNMIRHFLAAIVSGQNLEKFETPEWFSQLLPEDELPKLDDFGSAMESSELAARMIQMEDPPTARKIEAELDKPPKKLNPRRVRSLVNGFLHSTKAQLMILEGQHSLINSSLGRRATKLEVTLNQMGDLEMPRVIDELRELNPQFLPGNLRFSVDAL